MYVCMYADMYTHLTSACIMSMHMYIVVHMHLIIISVTHISMFRNYSFNFGRNVTKHGRNMERHREHNVAELKCELKSFHPSSCVFYSRGHY